MPMSLSPRTRRSPRFARFLGSNEVRRIAREIIDDNTGRWPYAVFLSEDGVHAMKF